MKKRLIRIFSDQLTGPDRIILPDNIPLSVVMRSGDTIFGTLVEQDEAKLILSDGRFHKHIAEVPEIDLVVYDVRDWKN